MRRHQCTGLAKTNGGKEMTMRMGQLASTVSFCLIAITAVGQTPRDLQMDAFLRWRMLDNALPPVIANEPAALEKLQSTATEAEKYFAARRAYLESQARQLRDATAIAKRNTASLKIEMASPESFLVTQAGSVAANLIVIRRGADPALEDLTKSLEAEQAALTVLRNAVQESGNSVQAIMAADKNAQQANERLAAESANLELYLRQDIEASEDLRVQWAAYYRALQESAREVRVSSKVEPVKVEPATAGPVNPFSANAAAPIAAAPMQPAQTMATLTPGPVAVASPGIASPGVIVPTNGAPTIISAPPANASTEAAKPAASPFPPGRFAGEWIYPTVGEHYHGARPEQAEMILRNENGKWTGSFNANFRSTPPAKGSPRVRFDFTGLYQDARVQTLDLVTSDKKKGSLQLTAVPAFNLLEVIFSIEGGSVTQGNFFLIRK